MNIDIKQNIGARFKLQTGKNGKINQQTDWFNNLVLDSGLARMSVGTWINRCCVGSGGSQVTSSQVALENFIASVGTATNVINKIQVDTNPFYYSVTLTWRFAEGVAAGNISEVGLGWSDTNLWNRALVKDAAGNQATITVLSDEFLDVVTEIRVYPQEFQGTFNLLDKLGNVISTHAYTVKPFLRSINMGAVFGEVYLGSFEIFTGELGADWIAGPSGTNLGGGTDVRSHPTTTSAATTVTIPLSSANNTHKSFSIQVKQLLTAGGSSSTLGYKMQIEPPIVKVNTQIMTYSFVINWGRYVGA